MGPKPVPPNQRFWRHVAPIRRATDCWLWIGAKTNFGYGSFKIGPGSYANTHRLMWVMVHGQIPDGLVVCHRCDVPACVNPSHLFLGTQKDNLHDMHQKGRYPEQPKGEAKPNAKLTEDIVREIRASTDSWQTLADRYGVKRATIQLVKNRRNWRHVA